MHNKLFLLLLTSLVAAKMEAANPGCTNRVCNVDANAANADTALHTAIQDTAIAGDTVQISAGTITVATQISINTPITIIGATKTCTSEPSNAVTADTTYDFNDTDCNYSPNTGSLAPGQSNNATVLEYTGTTTMFNMDVKGDISSPILRISGLTIHAQSSSQNGNLMGLGVTSTVKNFRMDHVRFPRSAWPTYIMIRGAVRGVIDHCIVEFGSQHVFEIKNGDDGNGVDQKGHFTWSQDTNWGGNDFLFVEHNYFKNRNANNVNDQQANVNMINGEEGRKLVVRHNYIDGGKVGAHGTENAGMRGPRADEYYKNHVNWSSTGTEQRWQLRNGNIMMWGNRYTLDSGTPQKKGYNPLVYRLNTNPGGDPDLTMSATSGWWGSSGTSPFDVNDTEGASAATPCTATSLQGTGSPGPASNPNSVCGAYVEAHAVTPGSYQYFPAGTAAGTAGTGSGRGVLVASGATFTSSGQYKNFGIVRQSDNRTDTVSSITLPNTIQTSGAGTTIGPGPTWAAGQEYRMYHVIVSLDQMGRGKGDLLIGTGTIANPCRLQSSPANSPVQAWPHEVLEPAYSWDNDEGHIAMFAADYLWQENRDYFNGGTRSSLGTGANAGRQETGVGIGTTKPTKCRTSPYDDPAGVTTTHPGVGFWDSDEPSVNGSSDAGALWQCTGPAKDSDGTWNIYYRPFTYPHPCVTSPTCSTADSAPTGILPASATTIIGQNANIDINPIGGVPRPSLSPTATPGQTPAWANFSGGAGGSSGTALHISGTPTGTATPYQFSVKATNAAVPGGTVFPFTLQTGTPTPTPTPPPTSPSPTAGSVVVGTAANITVISTSAGGPTPSVSPTASPGATPPWATFTAAPGQNKIGGTPTDTNGSPFRFSFIATNGGVTAIAPFTLTVTATPTPTPTPSGPSPAAIQVRP